MSTKVNVSYSRQIIGFDSYNFVTTGGVCMTIRSGADNEHIPVIFDARGNGDGKISCTITGDHESRITDYTSIILGGDDMETVVRRLTPLECERLQGYPDGWTDIGEWTDSKGKKHKDADSPRYKALGNSIALPFWEWMAKRMVIHMGHEPTMASLFDGIGGFPLVFSRAGVTPIWASEIEEFPIAVTKIRFSDKEEEDAQTTI